jgi:Zn-dependent peptidase ImmA (M78 family)
MSRDKQTNAAVVAKLQSGERLTRGGRALPATFLEEMVDLARRYAAAEKLVLGGTQVTYSPSSLDADLDVAGDVVQQAEKLAETERQRHGLPVGPVLEIAALIEEQGIKIIGRRFPESATSLGAFFFDGEIGPTILLNTAVTAADETYALARHFGHFLADFEPYPYLVCGRPDPENFSDPVEVRAHTFALAFLMPRQDLDMYREAMGLERDQVLASEFIDQLQVYFEVDPELILWRFLSLGWVDAEQLRSFLEHNPDIAAGLQRAPQRTTATETTEAPSASGEPDAMGTSLELPDRFVQLVAHAFGSEKIDVQGAAQLLGVDEPEATRLLSQFRYEEKTSTQAGSTAKSPAASRALPPHNGDTIH